MKRWKMTGDRSPFDVEPCRSCQRKVARATAAEARGALFRLAADLDVDPSRVEIITTSAGSRVLLDGQDVPAERLRLTRDFGQVVPD
jgi:hypothetical protein